MRVESLIVGPAQGPRQPGQGPENRGVFPALAAPLTKASWGSQLDLVEALEVGLGEEDEPPAGPLFSMSTSRWARPPLFRSERRRVAQHPPLPPILVMVDMCKCAAE